MTFKEFIESKGFDQRQLSKMTGLSTGTLSPLINGKSNALRMSLVTASKICRAMNISIDELFAFLNASTDWDKLDGIATGVVPVGDLEIIIDNGMIVGAVGDGKFYHPYEKTDLFNDWTEMFDPNVQRFITLVKEGKAKFA